MISIFPTFLVRLAGFSFQRLESLRLESAAGLWAGSQAAAARLAEAAAVAAAAIEQIRSDVHPAFRDAGAQAELKRAMRKVRVFAGGAAEAPRAEVELVSRLVPELARVLESLLDAFDAAAAARTLFVAAFDRELASSRERLRAIYRDDVRLQEAVFIQSSEAFARIQSLVQEPASSARNSRARERERLAMMYLQRFCAKNDTNSMCGPHGIGIVSGSGPSVELAIEDELARRRVYFSHWGAECLHDALAREAGAAARMIRKNSASTVAGERVSWCVITHDATTSFLRKYREAALTPELQTVLEVLETPRSLRAIQELLGERHELEEEESSELIDGLLEAGLLIESPSLPSGVFRPLEVVRARVDTWPEGQARERAGAAVSRVGALVERFEVSGMPARIEISRELDATFEELAGTESRRAGGQHYADRSLLHEDCFARTRARLPQQEVARLERNIGLLTAAASLPIELARENVRAWFADKFGADRRVPALEAHRAFDNEKPYELEASTPNALRLREHIAKVRAVIAEAIASAAIANATATRPEAVEGAPGNARASSATAKTHAEAVEGAPGNARANAANAKISAAALAKAVEGAPGIGRAGYASADVMLLKAPPGEGARWIVGEMHGFYFFPSCLLDVLPDDAREPLLTEMRSILARLASHRTTLEPLFLHTQATDRRYPMSTADLLIIGATDRDHPHHLGALELALVEGAIHYYSGPTEVLPVTIYNTYPFFSYTTPLAPLHDEFADKFFPKSLLPKKFEENDAPRLELDNIVFRRETWVRTAAALRTALEANAESELFAKAQTLRTTLSCGTRVFANIGGEPKPIFLDFDNHLSIETFAHLVKRAEPTSLIKLSEMLPAAEDLQLHGPDGPRTFELRLGVYRDPPALWAPRTAAGLKGDEPGHSSRPAAK